MDELKELFIPFGLAQRISDDYRDFDQPCFGHYVQNELTGEPELIMCFSNEPINTMSDFYICKAPLIAQVRQYLLTKHKIDIVAAENFSDNQYTWVAMPPMLKGEDFKTYMVNFSSKVPATSRCYSTETEAIIAGFNYALNLVTERKNAPEGSHIEVIEINS